MNDEGAAGGASGVVSADQHGSNPLIPWMKCAAWVGPLAYDGFGPANATQTTA